MSHLLHNIGVKRDTQKNFFQLLKTSTKCLGSMEMSGDMEIYIYISHEINTRKVYKSEIHKPYK